MCEQSLFFCFDRRTTADDDSSLRFVADSIIKSQMELSRFWDGGCLYLHPAEERRSFTLGFWGIHVEECDPLKNVFYRRRWC